MVLGALGSHLLRMRIHDLERLACIQTNKALTILCTVVTTELSTVGHVVVRKAISVLRYDLLFGLQQSKICLFKFRLDISETFRGRGDISEMPG